MKRVDGGGRHVQFGVDCRSGPDPHVIGGIEADGLGPVIGNGDLIGGGMEEAGIGVSGQLEQWVGLGAVRR